MKPNATKCLQEGEQLETYKEFFEHITYLYHIHSCEGKITDNEFINMFKDIVKETNIDYLISKLY